MKRERQQDCNNFGPREAQRWHFLYQITGLLLLSFVFGKPLSAQVLGKETEPAVPRAIFSTIFWADDRTDFLTYAPWGNEGESNATLLSLNISSNRPSGRFAYYGPSPLRLYRKNLVYESGEESGEDAKVSNELALVKEYEFSHLSDGYLEELLVLMGTDDASLRIKPISFDPAKIPQGCFLFQSLAKENTYFALGDQKFALPKGGSKLIKPVDLENQSNLRIEGFLQRNQKYQSAVVKKISRFREKRGLVLVQSKKFSINLNFLLEQDGPLSSVIGYGSPRSATKQQAPMEDNATGVSVGRGQQSP